MAAITELMSRRVLFVFVVSALLCTLFLQPALAQEKEEIIIEGEDKAPAESAFEYEENRGDTEAAEGLDKTGDVPGVREPMKRQDPTLKKDVGTRHQKLKASEETSVNEWQGWHIFLIVLGVGAVAATL